MWTRAVWPPLYGTTQGDTCRFERCGNGDPASRLLWPFYMVWWMIPTRERWYLNSWKRDSNWIIRTYRWGVEGYIELTLETLTNYSTSKRQNLSIYEDRLQECIPWLVTGHTSWVLGNCLWLTGNVSEAAARNNRSVPMRVRHMHLSL